MTGNEILKEPIFQTAFDYPSAQGIVGVGPSFFRAVFFEDFRFNQLVIQIVEVVLYFAVGQLAVDQVGQLCGIVETSFLTCHYCCRCS